MASLEIKDDSLIIHIHGWDKLIALRSTLTLPLAHVKDAVAHPADAQFDKMKGLRLAGGYWPGSFAAGYFWVTGGMGDHAHALPKLEAARKDIDTRDGSDPDGHFAAAREHMDQAIASVRQGLRASQIPESASASYLAFYDVHNPEKTIGLDVEHERLRRVVIQLDDETPEDAVKRVLAAIKVPA